MEYSPKCFPNSISFNPHNSFRSRFHDYPHLIGETLKFGLVRKIAQIFPGRVKLGFKTSSLIPKLMCFIIILQAKWYSSSSLCFLWDLRSNRFQIKGAVIHKEIHVILLPGGTTTKKHNCTKQGLKICICVFVKILAVLTLLPVLTVGFWMDCAHEFQGLVNSSISAMVMELNNTLR